MAALVDRSEGQVGGKDAGGGSGGAQGGWARARKWWRERGRRTDLRAGWTAWLPMLLSSAPICWGSLLASLGFALGWGSVLPQERRVRRPPATRLISSGW